jgi:hypothetical protein
MSEAYEPWGAPVQEGAETQSNVGQSEAVIR